MVQKGYGKHPEFDVEAYRRRLRILREITGGDGQTAFARRLGIAFKRWSNFERGYPLSREVAFLLHQKIPGISIEWIWSAVWKVVAKLPRQDSGRREVRRRAAAGPGRD